MSDDLTFFAHHKSVTEPHVRQAVEDLYDGKSVDWPASDEFEAFYQNIFTAYPENEGAWHTEVKTKGYWQLSMSAGQTEFNRYIGEQLMVFSVISYNPQSDEVLYDLSPL